MNAVCGGTGRMGCNASRSLSAAPQHVAVTCADADDSLDRKPESLEIPRRRPGQLRLLTYNVWFKADAVASQRMSAIADIIKKCDPDVVACQELTAALLDMLLERLGSDDWQVLVQTPREWYFTALLCRSEITMRSSTCIPFRATRMARAFQQVELDMPAFGQVLVATSHLESPQPGTPAKETRQQQFQDAIQTLAALGPRRAVWLGDMNWLEDDGTMVLPAGWVDAWLELHPGECGTTYHANQGRSFAGSCRFDRVLMRDFRPLGVFRLGMELIDGLGQFPSDHYGLFCLLES